MARHLVVLDMNGTLLLRNRGALRHSSIVPRVINGYHIYERPMMLEFIDFLFRFFDVAIWTGAMHKNAYPIAYSFLGEERYNKLLFFWTNENCIKHPGFVFEKPLTKIIDCFPQVGSLANITLVDDEEFKVGQLRECLVLAKTFDGNVDDRDLCRLCREIWKKVYGQNMIEKESRPFITYEGGGRVVIFHEAKCDLVEIATTE